MKKDNMKHYDAFISYRHTPLDMFVAKTLQKKLEEFKLPKNVKRQQADWERKKIERVFRDQDELPITSDLSDQIYTALTLSDYLIVICTPRIKESIWCQQEIKTFIEMRGYDHVLAVLAEGEPVEAFPDELVYRQEYYTDEYGNTTLQTVPVEPLAADIRGKNKKEIKKKIEEEITRLVAPMFSVDYDDLKQRAKERKVKKTLSIAGGIAAAFAVFGLVSGFMALRIIRQNNKIESQSIAIQSQNNEIKEQSNEIGKQQEQLQEQYNKIVYREAQDYGNTALDYLDSGDYENALHYAYMSVTEDEDGNALPVTPEGINALMHTTYAYHGGSYATPCMTFEFEHELIFETVSPERNFVMFEDEAGIIRIYDAHTLRMVKEIDSNAEGFRLRTEKEVNNTTQFLSDQTIVYETEDYFEVYNFVTGEIEYSFNFAANGFNSFGLDYVVPCYESENALFVCVKDVYVYDCKTKTAELLLDNENELFSMTYFEKPYITDDHQHVCIQYTDNDSDEEVFTAYHIETGEVVHELRFDKKSFGVLRLSRFDGDKFYIYASFDAALEEFKPYQVCCYDSNTGKELWHTDIQDHSYGGVTDMITQTNEDNCVLILDTDRLICLDKDTGKIIDLEECPGKIRSYTHLPDYSRIRILTDAGDSRMYLYTGRLIFLIQQCFGENLSFFNVASQHYYVTKEDLTKVHVWSAHMGQRVKMSECEVEGYNKIISSDEKYVFSQNSAGIHAYDLEKCESVWDQECSREDLYYFANAKLLAFGSSGYYIIDSVTGEVLMENNDGSFDTACGYNLEDGYFYYSKSGDTDVIQIDMNQNTEKKFLDCSTMVDGGIVSTPRVNKDGSVFVCYNKNSFQYEVYENGTVKNVVEEYAVNIDDVMFVPDHPYIMFIYVNKSIKVYNYETGEFIYSGKPEYDGKIESIETGNDTFSIIIHTSTNGNLFFTNEFVYLAYLDSIYLRRIVGTDDCVITNDMSVGIVPLYTVDMLKEDAEKLISGEVSLEYEIK